MIEKAISIAEVLYSGYSTLFIFDNVSSRSVYTKNKLYIYKISKKPSDK